MKKKLIILVFCLVGIRSFSQSLDPEGLKQRYTKTQNDTLRLLILDSLAVVYSEVHPDSSIYYADREIELAQAMSVRILEVSGMNMKAYALLNLGNYPASLRLFLDAIEIAQDPASEIGMLPVRYRQTMGNQVQDSSATNYRLQILAYLYFNLGILYENVNNPDKAFHYCMMSLKLGELTGNKQVEAGGSLIIGRLYLARNKKDSALHFETRAYELFTELDLSQYKASSLLNLGRIFLANGDTGKAIVHFREAIGVGNEFQYRRGVIAADLLIADIHLHAGRFDSALYYMENARHKSSLLGAPDLTLRVYTALSEYYQSLPNNDSVVRYLNLVVALKDSLFNAKRTREFQNIDYDALQRKKELVQARKDYVDQLQKYLLLSGLAVFLVIALILWQNNRQKQKAYKLLAHQKEETEHQKEKLEQALKELKLAQAQLVQKEKMASLGELTAGVAHEIQNPLNFVNNFSDLNTELIEETEQEIDKGNIQDAKALLKDLKENQQKINEHGKRADAIVKGMLQHSGGSSGEIEPTDLNALCDQYAKLVYQGLWAKDKSFHAKLHTEFDQRIKNVSLVRQDMGRVVMNLVNNAFYAVSEKSKAGIEGYKPEVSVSTRLHTAENNEPISQLANSIIISVRDNGNGIPDQIKDKIFQPFFTTKPTGQGTGLGLSLSYDIVKAHGGEIRLNTKVGEGAEFIIHLPMN